MKNVFAAMGLVAILAMSANAAIIEDFEGVTAPALPAGWTAVGTGVTTAANGNPGNALNTASGTNYLVNSGLAFDATQAISGSFDFYIVESGNYSNGAFLLGNVSGATAGDHIRVDLREKSFGARANILDADGTKLFDGSGNNNCEIATDEWNEATFTWTPTSGLTGDFVINWDGPGYGGTESMSVTGYTFNSTDVYFAFGTVDDPARYDNINITGTEIPEPASVALIGLGGLMMLRRRKA